MAAAPGAFRARCTTELAAPCVRHRYATIEVKSVGRPKVEKFPVAVPLPDVRIAPVFTQGDEVGDPRVELVRIRATHGAQLHSVRSAPLAHRGSLRARRR